MSITFKQLMEGYMRTCKGADACDVILAGDILFTEIVDKIAEANAKPTPDGRYLEIDPRASYGGDRHWRVKCLCFSWAREWSKMKMPQRMRCGLSTQNVQRGATR